MCAVLEEGFIPPPPTLSPLSPHQKKPGHISSDEFAELGHSVRMSVTAAVQGEVTAWRGKRKGRLALGRQLAVGAGVTMLLSVGLAMYTVLTMVHVVRAPGPSWMTIALGAGR